jgi:hypothetical protein
MKIQILGTGMVGRVLASRLVQLGHTVTMGTRDRRATLEKTAPERIHGELAGQTFSDWHQENPAVQLVDYAQTPPDSDLIINATNGQASLAALAAVGPDKLKHKVLLDVANPLDFSQGMPPSLFVCNTDSLAEQIQRAYPESYVVKSLNTMNVYLMVNPALLPGDHTVLVSGNRAEAKEMVQALLQEFGWKASHIIDLGDITTARATEMLLPVWIRLYGVLGTADFNFHILRKQPA